MKSYSKSTHDSFSLQGKVAVVTGAARGIGRAAAIELAKAGADIVGIDICAQVFPESGVKPSTPKDLAETGEKVEKEGRRFLEIKLDQRNLHALKAA